MKIENVKSDIIFLVDNKNKKLKKLTINLSRKVADLFEQNMNDNNSITNISIGKNNEIIFTWDKRDEKPKLVDDYIR